MSVKFRLFAGPNGSGKSTLFQSLRKQKIIHTELYVSADRIEAELKEKFRFYFNAYRVRSSQEELLAHITTSGLFSVIPDKNAFLKQFHLEGGVLTLKTKKINSYHASFIAAYLVEKLLESKQSFCFETVMSHRSKVQLLDTANGLGYKTYLYYLYTSDVDINIGRVKMRAEQGEHDVPEEKIISRYKRTLKLLPDALKIAQTAYVIDTSDYPSVVVLSKKDGKVIKYHKLPAITGL